MVLQWCDFAAAEMSPAYKSRGLHLLSLQVIGSYSLSRRISYKIQIVA